MFGIKSTAPRTSPSIYAVSHVSTYVQYIRVFIEVVARRGRNETVSLLRVSFNILFAGGFSI